MTLILLSLTNRELPVAAYNWYMAVRKSLGDSMKAKKIILKVLPYLTVFIITIIVTSIVINRENGLTKLEHGKATLPILYMTKDDFYLNGLCAYTDSIEENNLRNYVYPMNSDAVVKMSLKKMDNKIQKISYDLSSYEGRNSITSGEVASWNEDANSINFAIDFSTSIKDNKEYFLKLTVTTGRQDAIYATRIMFPSNREYLEALDFAKTFHGNTFNKLANDAIVPYLENRSDVDDNSLAHVSIGSTYAAMTWGEMGPVKVTEPVFSFTEINSSFTGITANYMVSSSSGGRESFYNVREYYRLRKTDDKMYLLDYYRDMEEAYDFKNIQIQNGSILLGIAANDNDIKLSNSGGAVAFEINGQLYEYNSHNNKMVRIFGYGDKEKDDIREGTDSHDIRIIKIDESGNVDFAVIGLMGGGEHEGKNALAIYNYNTQTNQTKEELYIPIAQPGQIVAEKLGKILYINDKNQLFVSYDSILYKIDLNNKHFEVMNKELPDNVYTASKDGHLVAISNNASKYDVTEIKVMNLDTNKEMKVSAASGEKLLPLGFLGTDFVYGIAFDSDISKDAVGNRTFMMSKLIIRNEEKVVKEYDPGATFVTGARIDGGKLIITRVNKSDGSPAQDDSIVNLEENKKQVNHVEKVTVAGLKQQNAYVYADTSKAPDKISVVEAKYVKADDNVVENQFSSDLANDYFAFAAGKICGVSKDTAEIISIADKNGGVVVDNSGKYLWIMGQRNRERELTGYELTGKAGSSYGICLDLMLERLGSKADSIAQLDEGKTPMEILQENAKVKVINLSGCGMDCALNFLSEGAPILAVNTEDRAMLITAYDIFNITVVSPSEGKTYKISLSDAREQFKNAGNLFITYRR